MSHSRGGSENVCVNYDTSTALALALASEMLPSWHLSLSLCVLSCLTCLRSLMLSYRAEILGKCACWPLCFKGFTWVYAGCSTHWVGLRSGYDSSSLFRGLMEFNTQTHWTGYIMQTELQHKTEICRPFFLMSQAAGFIISRWWDIWNSSADCIITVYGYLHRGIEQAP